MNFALKSHNERKIYQASNLAKSSIAYEPIAGLDPFPENKMVFNNYKIISWDLEPGDILAFNSFILHNAPGNNTEKCQRRAYSVRYPGEDVVYDPRPSTMLVLQNSKLTAGQVLDSKMFPIVWPN